MSEETIVNCPTCGKNVVWGEQSPFRPFCSKRCQLIERDSARPTPRFCR
ncbi:DNA gyrase inhibitor YacG, partial [Klebsiella pneumoniae]